jgi:nucleoside-diphosphate-sugar epimerase
VRVLILGAAGMLGTKLAQRLARDGSLAGSAVETITLADVVEPVPPEGASFATRTATVDVAEPTGVGELVAERPDVIFHLAAVVSGEAEADFDKGYRVNVDGTRNLLEEIRAVGHRPRLVFSSSVAVFGPPLPDVIPDDFAPTPATSYGTQKAIGELLLADYSRRGFVDGIGLRLPTVCVRPGSANLAASGFFSSILREPLAGREAVLPVADSVRHWFASPRAAVGFLVHAAGLDSEALGTRRSLTMPGLSATVAEQIEALRRVAGAEAAELIRREPDEVVARIVSGWPRSFDTRRADELGFTAETGFDEILRVHLEDELGRTAVAAA